MSNQPPTSAAAPPQDEEKHWPDAPIEELSDEEREMLLKQAGPVGEMARYAQQQYEEREKREGGDEPQAVAAEQQRLQEMGQSGAAASTSTTSTVEVIDTPEEEAANTGSQTERQRAEAKAAELGLEIRDYGSAGDWRVYDPSTGRQVAKSTVLT